MEKNVEKSILNSYIARTSLVLIGLRLVLLEILMELLYLLPKIVGTMFFSSTPYLVQLNIALGIVFLCLTIIQILLIIFVFIRWDGHYWEIRESEIIEWKGMLSKQKTTHSFVHIESLEFQQSLMGRLCNYGTITLYIPTFKRDIILADISNPNRILEILQRELPKPTFH